MRRSILAFATAAAVSVSTASLAMAGNGLPPFERTEQREACVQFDPLRQPFFGDLHVHTQYSLDAATQAIRNTPRDAYAFARGLKVGLPPYVNSLTNSLTGPPSSSSASGSPPAVSSHPYCFPGEKCAFMATNTVQLPPGRALDFAAVTDHAEFLGEGNICFYEEQFPCTESRACSPGQVCNLLEGRCVPAGYMSPTCILAREDLAKARPHLGTGVLFQAYLYAENPVRLRFCGPGGQLCHTQARNIWQQIQADAEAAYDRTAACAFTSFVGYEYTATPTMGVCSTGDGTGSNAPCWETSDCSAPGETCRPASGSNNLHRNIIFRNATVPVQPVSNVEAPLGCGVGASCESGRGQGPLASPRLLFETLERQCVDNGSTSRCQFLSIPHNSNLSGGAMFLMPESAEEARLRRDNEPLVELIQTKGQSECRFSPTRPGAWNTADEFCDFENLSTGRIGGELAIDPDETVVLPDSYVRNALKNGLWFRQETGVNPFQLGFVGSTDRHLGTPGHTEPQSTPGAEGYLTFSTSRLSRRQVRDVVEANPGGLAGIWAEENSRDSLFEAMRRRETFATSGTRPVVRFFGGFDLPADMCQKGDFASKGYAGGVPMGGTMSGPAPRSPSFAVAATMDPGWAGNPGTELQQIHIIKGWVDGAGQTHEKVYSVAGDPSNAGSVDLKTCKPLGSGAKDLCAVWSDPEFDPDQHAFYYARVLENQSCRSSQFFCNARGVDCNPPVGFCRSGGTSTAGCPPGEVCEPPARCSEFEYQLCCSGQIPKVVQQRAWTSPIWYTPTP